MAERTAARRALLAAPFALYLLVFLAWPILQAAALALGSGRGTFPDLVSFRDLAQDALFWRAVAGNLLVPAASVALELVAGVGLALLLAAHLPGQRLLRAAVVVPFALPEIVFLTVLRTILAPRGYVNGALAGLGLSPVEFLVPDAPLAYASVILVDAWRTTPVVFLIVLGALAALPPEVDEAARLDGARGFRRLVFVTLPMLRPAIVAALLLRALDALRIFAAPLVLTGVEGVPVLSTYAYHQWADQGDDALAAAASSVLALLCVVASIPLLRRRAEAT